MPIRVERSGRGALSRVTSSGHVRLFLSQKITIDLGRGALYRYGSDSVGIERGGAHPADNGVGIPVAGHRMETGQKQGRGDKTGHRMIAERNVTLTDPAVPERVPHLVNDETSRKPTYGESPCLTRRAS